MKIMSFWQRLSVLFISIYLCHGFVDTGGESRPYFLFSNNPTSCTARFGEYLMSGYCDSLSRCLVSGGSKVGFCAGTDVCCLVEKSCDSLIFTKFANILSEGFPSETKARSCDIRIAKYNKKTCQVRLDFEIFETDAPTANGDCDDSYFKVRGSHPNYEVPTICGVNTGQHMYLTYALEGDIKLEIKAGHGVWHIKVTQIECEPTANPPSVPGGCLQYFPAPRGAIRSFNYDSEDHQLLARLDYEICFQRTAPACSFSFTFTGLVNINARVVTDPTTTLGVCPQNKHKEFDTEIFTDSDCLDPKVGYIQILGGRTTSCTSPNLPPIPVTPSAVLGLHNLYCGTIRTADQVVITTPYYRIQVVTDRAPTEGSRFLIPFQRINC